jgi:hypothetical protein
MSLARKDCAKDLFGCLLDDTPFALVPLAELRSMSRAATRRAKRILSRDLVLDARGRRAGLRACHVPRHLAKTRGLRCGEASIERHPFELLHHFFRFRDNAQSFFCPSADDPVHL